MALSCQFVVRVYLDRKIFPGIYEFYQQGKFLPETGIVGFAQKLCAEASDQLGQGASGPRPSATTDSEPGMPESSQLSPTRESSDASSL